MRTPPLPPDTAPLDALFGDYPHRISFDTQPADIVWSRTDTAIGMDITLTCGCKAHTEVPLAEFKYLSLDAMLAVGPHLVFQGLQIIYAAQVHHPIDTLKMEILIANSGSTFGQTWIVAVTECLKSMTAQIKPANLSRR